MCALFWKRERMIGERIVEDGMLMRCFGIL